MTNREFFKAVQNGIMNDDVQAHATAEIEKMDARNRKRATTPSKTAAEVERHKANAEPMTAMLTVGKSIPKTGQEAVRLMMERYEANTKNRSRGGGE